jgi:hypothetical protein
MLEIRGSNRGWKRKDGNSKWKLEVRNWKLEVRNWKLEV